jgi:hypothetical protein
MAELPPRSFAARGLWWMSGLAAIAATLPGPASSLDGGVDGSWRWAINALPTPEARFGDVVFPYGPLGFALVPTYAGGKAAWALGAQWLLHALFAVALWRLLRRGGVARACLVGATLVFAHWAGLVYESQLVVGLLLLLAPAALGESSSRWPVLAAGALAGLALLAKLSLGAIALALVGALALTADTGRRRLVAGALATALAVLLLGGALLFGSARRARDWWTGSVEIGRGFAESMTIGPIGARWCLALGGLALYAALCAWLTARRSPARGLAWLAAPAVALAFAHAVTRLDAEHARLFAPLLVVALGLLAATAPRLERAVCAGGVLLAALAAWPLSPAASAPGGTPWLARDFNRRVGAAVAPSRAMARAARRTQAALGPLRVESPWIVRWREAAQTVDVLPWRLGYLAANDLRWRPSPTLQMFAAMTAPLDRRLADHYCGETAPDRLLLRYEGIDGRNLVWDTPLAWRAIAACYEPDPEASEEAGSGERRLRPLRRRASPGSWEWSGLGEIEVPMGEWARVPDGDGIVFAELTIQRAALGRLAGLVRPAAPLSLEVELPAGRRERWRLVRGTAPGGLQLAPLPGQLRHLNAWWNGNPFVERRAGRLRWLAERDSWSYQDRATIRFRRGRLAPLTPPAGPRSDGAAEP